MVILNNINVSGNNFIDCSKSQFSQNRTKFLIASQAISADHHNHTGFKKPCFNKTVEFEEEEEQFKHYFKEKGSRALYKGIYPVTETIPKPLHTRFIKKSDYNYNKTVTNNHTACLDHQQVPRMDDLSERQYIHGDVKHTTGHVSNNMNNKSETAEVQSAFRTYNREQHFQTESIIRAGSKETLEDKSSSSVIRKLSSEVSRHYDRLEGSEDESTAVMNPPKKRLYHNVPPRDINSTSVQNNVDKKPRHIIHAMEHSSIVVNSIERKSEREEEEEEVVPHENFRRNWSINTSIYSRTSPPPLAIRREYQNDFEAAQSRLINCHSYPPIGKRMPSTRTMSFAQPPTGDNNSAQDVGELNSDTTGRGTTRKTTTITTGQRHNEVESATAAATTNLSTIEDSSKPLFSEIPPLTEVPRNHRLPQQYTTEKQTLVVHPQPRLVATTEASSQDLRRMQFSYSPRRPETSIVRNLLSHHSSSNNIRGYLPAIPKLIPSNAHNQRSITINNQPIHNKIHQSCGRNIDDEYFYRNERTRVSNNYTPHHLRISNQQSRRDFHSPEESILTRHHYHPRLHQQHHTVITADGIVSSQSQTSSYKDLNTDGGSVNIVRRNEFPVRSSQTITNPLRVLINTTKPPPPSGPRQFTHAVDRTLDCNRRNVYQPRNSSQQLLTEVFNNEHPTHSGSGHYINPSDINRDVRYTENTRASVIPETLVSWCHTGTAVSSRAYQNLVPRVHDRYVGSRHSCVFSDTHVELLSVSKTLTEYPSRRKCSSDNAQPALQPESTDNNTNSPLELEMEMISSNNASPESQQSTMFPGVATLELPPHRSRDENSSPQSQLSLSDSAPPDLEPIISSNNTSAELHLDVSDYNSPSPPELQPEYSGKTSPPDSERAYSDHMTTRSERMFFRNQPVLKSYQLFPDNHQEKIFSWNKSPSEKQPLFTKRTEWTSSGNNIPPEIERKVSGNQTPPDTECNYNNYETVTESTTATTLDISNDDMEDETFDSDEDIDVGDSYDPDPGLLINYNIEADNNSDVFYDDEVDNFSPYGSISPEPLRKEFSSSSVGRRQDLTSTSPASHSMGAIITSSPPTVTTQEDSSSERRHTQEETDEHPRVKKMKIKLLGDSNEEDVYATNSKQRFVIVEEKRASVIEPYSRKTLTNLRNLNARNDGELHNYEHSSATEYIGVSSTHDNSHVERSNFEMPVSEDNTDLDTYQERRETQINITQSERVGKEFDTDREDKDSLPAQSSILYVKNNNSVKEGIEETSPNLSEDGVRKIFRAKNIESSNVMCESSKNTEKVVEKSGDRKSFDSSRSSKKSSSGVKQKDDTALKSKNIKAKNNGNDLPVKSRGVYRELGMRSNNENQEELGEFMTNSSVICKERGNYTMASPERVVYVLDDTEGVSTTSQVVFVRDATSVEESDRDLVFSLGDTALRCRMLVVMWALLGEARLKEVGFPRDPIHKILWRTVDICCSVAGVKSAAAVPLAPDHDCGRDMTCFRDHAHRFLEVCAPTREHWKRFGWASLTVDAVVRKIYVGEILPTLQLARATDLPEAVRHAMAVLAALETASAEQRDSRARFILPKASRRQAQEDVLRPCSEQATSPLGPAKKKRGRPAKISNKTDAGRVERVMLWRFLLNLLEDARNAPCIHWVRRDEGIFRILNTDWLARLWGRRHGNPRMTYEKMARAMRTYYRSKVLQPVPRSPNLPRKLVYKFNPAVIQKVAAAKLAAASANIGKTENHAPLTTTTTTTTTS